MEAKGSPIKKVPYLEAEETGGKEFSQLLVKPCNNNALHEDKKGVRVKNEFINNTFHQLDRPVCIRILQNASTSSKFSSGKNQATAQSRQSETFRKELVKTSKRSYGTGYSKRL